MVLAVAETMMRAWMDGQEAGRVRAGNQCGLKTFE
jgi:hypothetical protein